MTHAREAAEYAALVAKTRYIARYGAFLLGCAQEAAKHHTSEEVAEAEAYLRRPVDVAQLDLLLGKS